MKFSGWELLGKGKEEKEMRAGGRRGEEGVENRGWMTRRAEGRSSRGQGRNERDRDGEVRRDRRGGRR